MDIDIGYKAPAPTNTDDIDKLKEELSIFFNGIIRIEKTRRVKKPTLAEYEEIGRAMKVIHRELVRLYVLVSRTNGKTRPTTQEIRKLTKKLDALRSALEDEMFEQCPVEPRTAKGEEMLTYFYGGRY